MKCKCESDGRKFIPTVCRRCAAKKAVFDWLAKFAKGGQNALLPKPVPGRPPKISGEEIRWIAQTVKDNTPQQLKFEFGLWALSLIGELIRRQFAKSLALGSVS